MGKGKKKINILFKNQINFFFFFFKIKNLIKQLRYLIFNKYYFI
jgi:hypothetical protein